MTTAEIAKKFGLTAKKLNKILAEEGIQYKTKSGAWLLYFKYLNNRYAQAVPYTYTDSKGNVRTKIHFKWTQKGREFIYNTLKSKGILLKENSK